MGIDPAESKCHAFASATSISFLNGRSGWGGILNSRNIHGLMQVIDAGVSARDSHRLPPTRRLDLVEKGRDYVSAHLITDNSADDIAQALGVSYPALHYAFREALGVSPYQYVLTQKLHAVRRLLKSTDLSVGDACASFGFNTPSRFSRQYARLFGELPSVTRYAVQLSEG